ncbi:MAG: hypothetical protein ACT4PL_05965 [Phycisphaerales bacterium]
MPAGPPVPPSSRAETQGTSAASNLANPFMWLASAILTLAAVYLVLGLAFAIPFSLRGAAVIDAGAEKASLGFRFIILPGAMLLWPLLLMRWLRAQPRRDS